MAFWKTRKLLHEIFGIFNENKIGKNKLNRNCIFNADNSLNLFNEGKINKISILSFI